MKEKIKLLKNFQYENTEVDSVQFIENNTDPITEAVGNTIPFYRVELTVHTPENTSFKVAVGLPIEKWWNGKFLGTGNGGAAGGIVEISIINGVSRGYVTANTDMGVSQDTNNDIGNIEVWKNYGYRSTHIMTQIGKQLCEYFYHQSPEHSYFMGGSTGGQQALSLAQRFPTDYDGIVCLSPAFNRVDLHTFFLWNWQHIHRRLPNGFNKDTLEKWHKIIIDKYVLEAEGKIGDNYLTHPHLISNPLKNTEMYTLAQEIFTNEEIDALFEIYEGPKDLLPHLAYFPGAELENLGLMDLSNKEQFAKDYFYVFRWALGENVDLLNTDIDELYVKTKAILAEHLDATSTNLDEFKANGGKLLNFVGSSDAIIPYQTIMNYYEEIKRVYSPQETQDFYRFSIIPGWGHIYGGPAILDIGMIGLKAIPRVAEHDVLSCLEAWVEKGITPTKFSGVHLKREENDLVFDYSIDSIVT